MINRFFCVFVCTPVGLLMVASCQESPDPRAVLNKAIVAHGGQENIKKHRMGVLKGVYQKTPEREATQEEVFDLPKRWKRITTMIVKGKKNVFFTVMTEGKLWDWEEGSKPQLAENQMGSQPGFDVITVLVKLTNEKVELSPLRRIKVNGRNCVGLRAVWDAGAGDYYFEETTGMLAQANFKWQPEPGKELDSKTVFTNYKEIDGIKLPYRRTSYIKGGDFKEYTLLTDFTVTEVRILDKLPEDAFSVSKEK